MHDTHTIHTSLMAMCCYDCVCGLSWHSNGRKYMGEEWALLWMEAGAGHDFSSATRNSSNAHHDHEHCSNAQQFPRLFCFGVMLYCADDDPAASRRHFRKNLRWKFRAAVIFRLALRSDRTASWPWRWCNDGIVLLLALEAIKINQCCTMLVYLTRKGSEFSWCGWYH